MVRIIDLDSMGGAELTDNNYFIVSNTGTASGLKKLSYGQMISGIETGIDADTTYSQSAVTTTGGALLRLTAGGSGSGNDDVKFASGTNVTVAYTDSDTITISASGIDSAAIVSLIDSDYVQARQDYAYSSLTGVPSTFTPATHNQAWSTITSTPTTLSGYGITDALDSALIIGFTDERYVNLSGDSMTGDLWVDGAIYASGNITGYGTFSDLTLKENIVKIESALDKILNINGYTFNYIGHNDRIAGLIAQEVEQVHPEVVYETLDGKKAIYYGNMAGLIVEAIKELKIEIDEIKEKLK